MHLRQLWYDIWCVIAQHMKYKFFFAQTFVYNISQFYAKSNKLISRWKTRAMVYEFNKPVEGNDVYACIETMRYYNQDVWASCIYMLTGLRHNVHKKSKLYGDREFDGDIFKSTGCFITYFWTGPVFYLWLSKFSANKRWITKYLFFLRKFISKIYFIEGILNDHIAW